MRKLEILLSNPDVRCVSRPGVTWFLTGCDESAAARLERAGHAEDGIEAELCARASDATVLKVVHEEGRAREIHAWRGATAKHDLFRLETGTGNLVFADHFQDLLTRLPVGERAPSDDTVVDHFLFRAPIGADTYCRPIRRVANGERLSIDANSGIAHSALFHRLEEPPQRRTVAAYLDDADSAFTETLGPLGGRQEVAAFFSGGVDSTLLHAYLGRNTAALNLIVDVRNEAASMEAAYASDAAAALGIELQRLEVRRSDFLGDLERATAKAGMPLASGILAVFDRVFATGHAAYVTGWSADGLFGHAALFHRIASFFASPLPLHCLRAMAPAIARKDMARHNIWRERLEQLFPIARQIAAAPDSIHGFSARAATFAEFDVATMIFGEDAIARRLANRLDYGTARVAMTAPPDDRFTRHFETGSWLDLLCDDFASQMRHLAMARGKSVLLPFLSGPVVRSALRIPVQERYLRGVEGKYILKRLLERHLPGYPTNQRKGATFIAPFPQYYRHGPLSQIWDSYDLPDFIEGEARTRIMAAPLRLTYSAVAYAIWLRRVLKNPALGLLDSVRIYKWDRG